MFDLSPVAVPNLIGKTILVTGAGRGIGAVLTMTLLQAGARVFAGHVGGGVPDGAEPLALDVTDQAQVDAAIARIREAAGRLDVLVNNAGLIDPIGHFADLSTDDLRAAFEVNALGLHRMTVAALPLLEAAGGRVVNAGTGAATTPMEGWTAYCASKAAARMMTLMADAELAPRGLRSFFLGIPPTDTAMQGAIRDAGLNPISRIPQSDLVDPAIPASVMAWLCGPGADGLDTALLDVRDERFQRREAQAPAIS